MHIVLVVLVLFGLILLILSLSVRIRPGDLEPQPKSEPAKPFEAIVDESDFDEMVLETSMTTPVLVDFFASWCEPCQEFTPLLSDLAQTYGGALLLAKIDVDHNPQLNERFQIEALPSVLLFKNGECVDRFEGARMRHGLEYFLALNDVRQPALPAPAASSDNTPGTDR